MRGRLSATFVLLLIVFVPAMYGQSSTSPYWKLYEEGNASLARREYGEALKLYKDAIAAAGIFPEAEMALGDVYRAESEFGLAQSQYEKAYNMRNGFDITGKKYDVLYKLARLFQDQELYKLMEDRLLLIIADDKHFSESPRSQVRTQVERNYLEKGLDHVLLLYGFNDAFAVSAHSTLGWFYYRSGRYAQAILQLLYSTINRASQINEYLRSSDVDYQFSTLGELMAAIDKDPELRSLASNEGFFKDLYYLAGSTFANGYPEHALGLWRLISSYSEAGTYQALSAKQIRAPSIEPLLGTSPRLSGKSGY